MPERDKHIEREETKLRLMRGLSMILEQKSIPLEMARFMKFGFLNSDIRTFEKQLGRIETFMLYLQTPTNALAKKIDFFRQQVVSRIASSVSDVTIHGFFHPDSMTLPERTVRKLSDTGEKGLERIAAYDRRLAEDKKKIESMTNWLTDEYIDRVCRARYVRLRGPQRDFVMNLGRVRDEYEKRQLQKDAREKKARAYQSINDLRNALSAAKKELSHIKSINDIIVQDDNRNKISSQEAVKIVMPSTTDLQFSTDWASYHGLNIPQALKTEIEAFNHEVWELSSQIAENFSCANYRSALYDAYKKDPVPAGGENIILPQELLHVPENAGINDLAEVDLWRKELGRSVMSEELLHAPENVDNLEEVRLHEEELRRRDTRSKDPLSETEPQEIDEPKVSRRSRRGMDGPDLR